MKWVKQTKSIHERPKDILTRDTIGYLECDSIVGKRNEPHKNVTIVDRPRIVLCIPGLAAALAAPGHNWWSFSASAAASAPRAARGAWQRLRPIWWTMSSRSCPYVSECCRFRFACEVCSPSIPTCSRRCCSSFIARLPRSSSNRLASSAIRPPPARSRSSSVSAQLRT